MVLEAGRAAAVPAAPAALHAALHAALERRRWWLAAGPRPVSPALAALPPPTRPGAWAHAAAVAAAVAGASAPVLCRGARARTRARSCLRGLRCARGAARALAEATPESFLAAISTCAESSQYTEALDLLGQMPAAGVPVDVTCYNAVLRAYVNGNQLEWVLSLFGDMARVGLVPDVETYNLVLAACESAGQWQHALHYLEGMRSAGLQPDEQTFACAVGACASGDQWQWAVHLVTDMQKQGVVPTHATFSTAIAVCRRCEQAEWAEALTGQMQQAGVAEAPAAPPEPREGRTWVNRVTALQDHGTDLEKARWNVYCDLYGDKQNHPAEHDDAFLEGFFNLLSAWPTDADPDLDAESHGVLAMRVLDLYYGGTPKQKFRWERFCELQSRGGRDPLRQHDAQSLRQFLEQEAAAAASGEETKAVAPAEEEEPSEPLSMDSICKELAKFHDPARLFEEALSHGAFSIHSAGEGRLGNVVDLHGLSEDVAKVAMYYVLRKVLLLPRDNPALREGMTVVVGKGLHSEDGERVLGPAVHKFLREYLLFELEPLEDDMGVITLRAIEIRRVHGEHPFWVAEREKLALGA